MAQQTKEHFDRIRRKVQEKRDRQKQAEADQHPFFKELREQKERENSK